MGREVASLVLVIDIGNSTTSFGLFDQESRLQFRSDLATRRNTSRDQCALDLLGIFQLYQGDLSQVSGVLLSSVVPSVTTPMARAVEMLTGKKPLQMGPGVKTGLNIKSDIHSQMGSDIVACAVSAMNKYPGPIIVVDMGTAITMSYIRGNSYEGCVIMPGIHLSLEALSDRAAGLPHISIARPSSIFGHNTVDAMQAGVVYGNASMVDGMIERLESASQPASTLVATGGNAPLILQECKREIVFDANLLLDGLYHIYRKNTK